MNILNVDSKIVVNTLYPNTFANVVVENFFKRISKIVIVSTIEKNDKNVVGEKMKVVRFLRD